MFFFQRIWNNKFRNIIIFLILFFPTIEVIVYIIQALNIEEVYYPDYNFFLSGNVVGVGHTFQALYLWPLPLYLLLIFSNDCLMDFETGYNNILISKMGKEKYIKDNLKKSFLGGSALIFISLLINLAIIHILFAGGTGSPYSDELIMDSFLYWETNHKTLANLLFAMVCAMVSGTVSMAGTMLSISVKKRKIVYSLILLLWFILFLKKNSIMLLFQVHSEYGLNVLVPILLQVIMLFGLLTLTFYIKETWFEKKSI